MVAVQVTLTLTALLSVAALSLDVGVLLAERRHAQAVADAAALSGAIDLYTNYQTYSGNDSKGTAKTSALTTAKDNGYTNDGTTSTVTVNIPPTSGNFSGKAGYVEVIVQYNQTRGFSRVLGAGTIPVKARAVATGRWVVPKGGILALDPTASGSITASGGGTINANGGTVIDNSNNNSALIANGGGTITANEIDITGSYSATVGTPGLSTTPKTGLSPTPDPYAYLSAPTAPPAGTITKKSLGGGGFLYTLTPGSYGGSGDPKIPNFNSNDQVVFEQASYGYQSSYSGSGGIYYLASGGLTSNGATMTMDSKTSGGMMFYNAGTGSPDKINIAGSSTGTVNLGGLTSGIYQGLLVFQARGATEDVSLTGNGSFTMEGALYSPSGTLKLAGNGSLSIMGSNLVADQISISGNGNVTVDYNGYTQPRARYIGLVE
jgi:Flp pilus assembly protein TadG